MKNLVGLVVAFLMFSVPAIAQEHKDEGGGGQHAGGQAGGQKAGGGHIPSHGPTPSRGQTHATPSKPAPAHAAPEHQAVQNGHPEGQVQENRNANVRPHVEPRGDVWVGDDSGRNDPHYHLDHPWQYGHFTGEIGPSHVWRIEGGGPSRFWFGGFYFSIAPYDVGNCDDWDWSGDEIVIYDDPDHVGWYLAYNVRLGTYCHVMYLG